MNDIYGFAILSLKVQLADCVLAGNDVGAKSCTESVKLLQLYSTFDTMPLLISTSAAASNQATN